MIYSRYSLNIFNVNQLECIGNSKRNTNTNIQTNCITMKYITAMNRKVKKIVYIILGTSLAGISLYHFIHSLFKGRG